MKKISFIIILIFILPKFSMAYEDISNHWSKDYINNLTELQIVSGYPDGMFKPDNNVTKAEFITMLIKALKVQTFEAEGHWANKFAVAAKKNYIIDETDLLDYDITREEVLKMLVRSCENSSIAYYQGMLEENSFVDVENCSKEVKNSVEILYRSKILSGYEDGTVRLPNFLTRAEACTFIYKFINNKESLDNYRLKNSETYYSESVFINHDELPYELKKWKNETDTEEKVITKINSIDCFEFSSTYFGKYRNTFDEIYHSENPYFMYRRNLGDGKFVVAIEFETENKSQYETFAGYNYLTLDFLEENIKIIDSFDIDEINNQREKKPYSGIVLKPFESHKTIAFYIVDNFPQENIKLSRNITTMYDAKNKTNIDVGLYRSIVIGNLK